MAKAKKQEKSIEQRLEEGLVLYEKTPYELPTNWCWTRVENCFSMKNGYAFKQSDFSKNGKIPVIKIRNLQDGEIVVDDNTDYVLDDFSSEFIISSGDLLVALSGATTGKFGVYKLKEKAYLNQRVGNIGINSNCIVEKYRNYFFEKSSEEILKSAYGGAQPNISWNDIKLFFFPLAPLEEQKRIVEIIEKQFAKLDEARDLIQKSLDSFSDRKSAILHKAFTGELTKKWRSKNEVSIQTWEKRKLKDCGTWCGGGTPSMQHPEYWEKGTLLWITAKDMKSDIITDTQMRTNMFGVKNSSANYIEKPSILFVMRSGILRRTLPVSMVKIPFTVNQDLKVLTPDKLNLEYLFWACKAFERDILKKCMKSGTTVESINSHALLEYELPVPQKCEQEEIVRILDSIFEKEDKSKELIDMLDKIDEMKKSILARAFRGQLGTSNPTDEPATDLLRKILENN